MADQAIRRLKQIHDNSYLYCDIKQDNFLLGTGNSGHVLYTINFSLARDFNIANSFRVWDNRSLRGTD
jgi:casein kinase 1 epsilon